MIRSQSVYRLTASDRANRSSQKRSKVNVRHVVEGLEWRSPLSLL